MDKRGEQKATVIGLLVAVLIGASVYAYNRFICPAKPSELLDQPEQIFEKQDAAFLIVHVCGAVRREGVYRMRPGDRIIDAIGMAGGAGANADLSSVNLAENIKDGLKISIPEKVRMTGKPGSAIAVKAASGKININQATVDELDSLPGIGPATAQKIIELRPFFKAEDLLRVPRFGKSRLDKLKDRITI